MENELRRGAGILCHISSLPGKYGIGNLGAEAYKFADFLKSAHVKYWQILPLQQTGFGDSPYQSVCCTSGNPYFIDLEKLRDDGLLDDDELASCELPEGDADYERLYVERFKILRLAYSRFDTETPEFKEFIGKGEFEDYALFMALKTKYNCTFDAFPEPYKRRDEKALAEFKAEIYSKEYCFWQFLQFEFAKQWRALKNYVNSLGIKIIGDIPLYVAYDSSDVWSHPSYFQLDGELKPTAVAGVPPDYFSPTGQLWGNPLYNWSALAATGYAWWVDRIGKAAEIYDVIRIDHFRGFDRYYSVPAGSETAETGEWQYGPGARLFERVEKKYGKVDIIAEDLGVIDNGVLRLKAKTGFPGMKILMFAFDGNADNPHLPSNTEENFVVYTGTHDNSTSLGFLEKLDEEQFKQLKKRLRETLAGEEAVYPVAEREDVVRAFCISAMASRAYLAVLPVQDLLCLGEDARMNVPSVASDNWKFRLKSQPTRYSAAVMRGMVKKYNRE